LDLKENIIPLLEGYRRGGQIYLIFPYVDHVPFEKYYLTMREKDIREYMRALFTALMHVHSHRIIHRDIKPDNFLYCAKSNTYYLIDFGLAQFLGKTENESSTKQSLSRDMKRQIAPRAGTRGFRAPEVLLRVKEQTTTVDTWSAGVILLSILSGRYPFFNSPDDLTSLAEIIAVFGVDEIISSANSMGKLLHTNFPPQKVELFELCKRLRIEAKVPPLKISLSVYDLLEQCLKVDPRKRVLSTEAMTHKFFSESGF